MEAATSNLFTLDSIDILLLWPLLLVLPLLVPALFLLVLLRLLRRPRPPLLPLVELRAWASSVDLVAGVVVVLLPAAAAVGLVC